MVTLVTLTTPICWVGPVGLVEMYQGILVRGRISLRRALLGNRVEQKQEVGGLGRNREMAVRLGTNSRPVAPDVEGKGHR